MLRRSSCGPSLPSAGQRKEPSSSQRGPSWRRLTQAASFSVSSSVVLPVAGSTCSSACSLCERPCTRIVSGPSFVPFHVGEVRIRLVVPFDPERLARLIGVVMHRDDPQPRLYVGLSRPRIEERLRRFVGMNRIGHLPHLDAVGVGLFISDRLAVRRPPVAGEAIHLLLGDELGQAVRLLLRAAGRQGFFAPDVIKPVNVVVEDVADVDAIRREFRIDDDAFARQEFVELARLALHPVEPAGQGDEEMLPVRRQLEVGEAADADALPLPPSLLPRAEVLLGALEQLFRREQFARLARRHIELVQALFRRLRRHRRNSTNLPSAVGFGLTGRPSMNPRVSAWRRR